MRNYITDITTSKIFDEGYGIMLLKANICNSCMPNVSTIAPGSEVYVKRPHKAVEELLISKK